MFCFFFRVCIVFTVYFLCRLILFLAWFPDNFFSLCFFQSFYFFEINNLSKSKSSGEGVGFFFLEVQYNSSKLVFPNLLFTHFDLWKSTASVVVETDDLKILTIPGSGPCEANRALYLRRISLWHAKLLSKWLNFPHSPSVGTYESAALGGGWKFSWPSLTGSSWFFIVFSSESYSK